MGQIVWSEESQRWLRDIYEYIAEDNPQAALRTIENIRRRVRALESFPELGRRYPKSSRHVRIILSGHYRIAYLVHENRDVTILGIFHPALDISNYEL